MKPGENDITFVSRDISWLSFNERVLQEADDNNVPLIERMRFLGIFSNNRDEFFRVRVAAIRRMREMGRKGNELLGEDPEKLLDKIQNIILKQEKLFNKVYLKIRKELSEKRIFIINENQLSKNQTEFLQDYFKFQIRPALVPIIIDRKTPDIYIKDKAIYLGVKFYKKGAENKARYALIEIPSQVINRFIELPSDSETDTYIILLDDVIRLSLPVIFKIFPFDVIEAYNFKMTRDAELDLDQDINAGFLEKMEKSLSERKKGEPVRFVYDREMPEDLLNALLKKLNLTDLENIIPAGRYHNFKDFMSFPAGNGKGLLYEPLPPLEHPLLKDQRSYLDVISKQDILISYPYQQFSYIINLLREAAIDPRVRSIKINLYRVSKNSRIINALISAAQNGKEVIVVVELQARFDEENNIRVSNKLQEAGAKVIFGVPGLKVHSKLILISRKETKGLRFYTHIGTGNFHEGTARVYGDHSLLTANQDIGRELSKVFEFFALNYKRATFKHLMVSPFNQRRKFIALIQNEIINQRAGKPSGITLKLNNLVDESMIRKLYEAASEGVPIKMMIRGICSLIPGVKGLSENIEAYSVIDRFLEHARVIVFQNAGDPLYFISSADWMTRNLDFRVEVTTPVYDTQIQKELKEILDIQFSDNVKCRIIDRKESNSYKKQNGNPELRSQMELYYYFKKKLEN
jgi:polyphosphate kinase